MKRNHVDALKEIHQNQAYLALRQHFASEGAIVPEGESGTVYTPYAQQQQMVYLLIHDFLNINANESLSAFKTLWETYHLDNPYESNAKGEGHRDFSTQKDIDLIHLKEKAAEVWAVLQSSRILDLCSGTGMLLISYVEFIDFILHCLDERHHLTAFVAQNVYAIDIDERAVQSMCQIFEAFFEHIGVKTPSAFQFLVGDALECALPTVDLVLSNPPYIGEKGHQALFNRVKQTPFGRKYYEGKMDYFYFFIYRSFEVLSRGGVICFLTSNYFFTADGAEKLRLNLRESFYLQSMLNFENAQIFQSRGLHACIYTLSAIPNPQIRYYHQSLMRGHVLDSDGIFNDRNQLKFICSDIAQNILDKIQKHQIGKLGDFYDVKQGVVSGADRYRMKGSDSQPIFVFTQAEFDVLPAHLKPYFKPFYKNSQILKLRALQDADFYILYLTRDEVMDEVHKQELIEMLSPYRAHLECRREVANGARAWYELTWPRTKSIFENPKIVAPQRRMTNAFAYVEGAYYASADVYYILPKGEVTMDLKALTLCINSQLMYFWLYHQGKRKGKLLELYATPLKAIPRFAFNRGDNERLMTLTKVFNGLQQMASESQIQEILDEVDDIMCRHLALTTEEIQYIKGGTYENHH